MPELTTYSVSDKLLSMTNTKAVITRTNPATGHVTYTGQTDDRTAKAIAEYIVEDGGTWVYDDGRTLKVVDSQGRPVTVELTQDYARL